MTASRTRSTRPQLAHFAAVLLTSTMLSGVPQAFAQTLPTGGSVAAGSATIATPSNGALTVTQSSSSAVVNWQSFSVAQGNAVNFVQPSSTAAILNRVTGSATSTIAGQINANGQVYLVNPNGIAITSTGMVNAAGFVASTLGISDSDFMSGKRTFTGNGASASVSNAGSISIGRGGYAALLGGSVDNAGTITVPLGKVGLGSGEQATLDLSGDGFMQVAMPTNAAGSNALVSNSGKISANGGSVQLSAAAARDMARQAINMSGTIEAKSVGGRNGAIILGGSEGAVAVSGKLNVASRKAKGGSITVTGRDIKLAGATLDASGKTGGGSINIGGGRQGQGPLQRAETTSVDSATTIKADARSTGNGGNVVVWSDLLTIFAGQMSARGGALSGNGGEAEVSGKAKLAYAGFTDLSATHGSFGTLLLDPYNVTISSGTDNNQSGFTATGDDSVINVGTLQAQLAGANVAVSTGSGGSQAGNITVANALTWTAGTTLTLNAANNIVVNAPITFGGAAGAGLTLNAAGSVQVNKTINVIGAGAVNITAAPVTDVSTSGLTFALGASIDYGGADHGGTFALNGTSYTLVYSMTNLDAIDGINATSGATVTTYGSGTGGNYAIATNLDASGINYNMPLLSGGLSGKLDGLGHTVSNLRIGAGGAGMISVLSGTLSNFGMVGGLVVGTGTLAGSNNGGVIQTSYSTADVIGSADAGGLVGFNTGTIQASFATGNVTIDGQYAGGLVGRNTGLITNSFASGNVTAGQYAGGLVGRLEGGSVQQSLFTGMVSGGGGYRGGIVGYVRPTAVFGGGSNNNLYWNTQTSGTSVAAGDDVNSAVGATATGQTTADLQTGTLPSGLSSMIWAAGAGLYPYLRNFYPSGPQVLSGTSYSDGGTTGSAGTPVGLIVNGTSLGTVSTGADGYYYFAVSPGAWSNGASLLAYSNANSATLAAASGAAVQNGFNLYGQTLTALTSATRLSTTKANVTIAAGGNAAATAAINGATLYNISATGATFTIDQTINASSFAARTTTAGALLIVSNAITIQDGGNLALNSAGALMINAPVTMQGASAASLGYDASNPANLTFATGAPLTFTDSSGNAISSGVGGSLSINGNATTLLYSMADVAFGNAGLGGSYALAGNLDATGTTYSDALIGTDSSHIFSGSFEGLGHTIRNLTVNKPGDFAGLFGYSSGIIRDIGLTGGSVSGGNYVGGLVGVSTGTISNAYATGAVSGVYIGGGLVGALFGGTISNAYATGAVSGDNSYVGGLVGYQDGGTIINAYATGAATGNASIVGGLVGGLNSGTISSAYATGAVSGGGGSLVGGLVGKQFGGTISNAYWDTQTSGITTGIGSFNSGNVTGLTTAQFQTATAASNLGLAFSGGAGLYPYLTSFYPSGVQVVSGFAYQDGGTTPLASGGNGAVTVNVVGGGTAFGAATSGANGYYYMFGPPGSIANGATLLAYIDANQATGAKNSATLATANGTTVNVTSSLQTGVNIYNGALAAETSELTLSAAEPAVVTAANAAATTASLAAVTGALAGGRFYNATGASFTIDQSVTTSNIFGASTAAGAPLTVSNTITINNGGSLGLLSGGALAINAPITVNGAGGVVLAYDASNPTNLSFGLTGTGFNGGLTFANADGSAATTSQGGTLSINGAAHTLLYSMADVVNINTLDIGGIYGLARNLDASGTTYSTGVIVGGDSSGNGPAFSFYGTFEGLGHAIANLTITGGSNNFVGLFGFSVGTIRDVGLTGASVSGNNYVGGLVGYGGGLISNVYASGAVSGSNDVGGLVGYQVGGSFSHAYATGAVNGGQYVGGLVGLMDSGTISDAYATSSVRGTMDVGGFAGGQFSSGTINNAYATGAVSGDTNVGGLIGSSRGTISNAYATGAVSGASSVGGIVGQQFSGTISNVYYDINTSGQPTDAANANGLTTAQFQTLGAATNLGGAFAGGAGLYPYLASFFPNGVQAISGTSYADSGVTLNASGSNGARYVYVDVAGQQYVTTTGANGYYYVMVANGTLSSAGGGTATLAYTRDGSVTGPVSGATLSTATGSVQHFDIWTHNLIAPTTATSLSTAPTTAAALLGANGGADQTLLAAAAGGDTIATDAISGVAGLGSTGYIATGAGGFNIDQGISAYGLYVQTTSGPITVSSAQTLGGPINLTLLSAGGLTIDAPIQVNGNGAVTLAYDASSVSNLSFGLTGSGFTGSLTYANADGTAATSSQGGTLTVNGNAITLLYSMADVNSVNSGLNGSYALAGSLDASGTTYTDALIGSDYSNAFTGSFEGLGHTIRNLTVNKPGDYAGLFGYNLGNIRDIGLTGGSVSGGNYVGGLVGLQSGGKISDVYATGAVSGAGDDVGGLVGYLSGGTIRNAYATGAVSSSFFGATVGGLVGFLNGGTISNAYATGAVSGISANIGGLVGFLNAGTISNAYATGAVSSANGGYVGGLVGVQQVSTISNAYATGAVSGSNGASVGGLVGYDFNGTFTNAYWDAQTSGTTSGIGNTLGGNATVSGLTTADFQTATAASNLGSAFAGGAGLYPYLASFYPNGVQAISGTAYTDSGATVLASGANGAGLVYVRVGSGAVQTVTTGANGYYYAIVANGTIDTTNGTNVLAFTQANANTGAADGAAFQTAATGSVTNFDISGGWRRDTTGLGTLSALDAAYATSVTGTIASGLSLANRSIFAVSDFSIDTVLAASGTLNLSSPSNVTQSAAISANTLILQGASNTFTLTNTGNQFSQFVASGGAINVYDASSLTIAASATDACNCTVAGVSTNQGVQIATAGDLTIASGAFVAGASPVLAASGAFTNNAGSSAVTATSGRWLVYSADPAGNTFGGLDSGNTAIWGTAAGGTVTGSGNRYVFSAGRTLTVTSQNDSKTYGEDITGRIATDYVIAGFDPGLAGVYLADTVSTAYSGTASVTSSGAAGTANVTGAPYAITAALGSLASSAGYSFAYVNSGVLTVNQRAITVTANSGQSLTYGDTPTLAFTVGGLGLVNGDTLSGALAGVNSTSGVGTYAISQGTLAASNNYTLTYVGANVTVTARPITVTADAQSRIYGDVNPALTYAVGGLGLVNGDTLSGSLVTLATGTSNVGSYAITQGTLAASSNYALTYVGANLGITARALTVTADALSKTYGDANPALTYTVGGLGLVNGDLLSGALATDADSNSTAGRYAITRGSLSASSNYAITFVPGTLTIDAVINPSNTDLASTVANSTPAGATITTAMLPIVLSPPSASGSANGSDSTVISADPRFDGVVICSGLNCVVAQ